MSCESFSRSVPSDDVMPVTLHRFEHDSDVMSWEMDAGDLNRGDTREGWKSGIEDKISSSDSLHSRLRFLIVVLRSFCGFSSSGGWFCVLTLKIRVHKGPFTKYVIRISRIFGLPTYPKSDSNAFFNVSLINYNRKSESNKSLDLPTYPNKLRNLWMVPNMHDTRCIPRCSSRRHSPPPGRTAGLHPPPSKRRYKQHRGE